MPSATWLCEGRPTLPGLGTRHTSHMMEWFRTQEVCPTAVGATACLKALSDSQPSLPGEVLEGPSCWLIGCLPEASSRAHLQLDWGAFLSKIDMVWAVPEPLPSQLLAVCCWHGCRWKRTRAGGNTCLQSCVYLSDVDLKPPTAS